MKFSSTVALLGACSLPVASGFTSIAPASRPVLQRLGMVDTLKKDEMTAQDEDILFGEEGSNPPFPDRHRPQDRYGNVMEDRSLKLNPLDHAKDPLVNKLHTMRETLQNCPGIWQELAEHCGDKRAVLDDHLCDEKVDLTFAEMEVQVRKSAQVFKDLGIQKGVNVALFGENSAKWLIADHGIQMAGGASAVRGADAPLDELRYIYDHSDSYGVVVLQGPQLLKKLAKDQESGLGLTSQNGAVSTVILMHKEKATDEELRDMETQLGVTIQVFSDLLSKTEPMDRSKIPKVTKDDLSTIVYTSGTTGHPKGVMLSHGNMLHQTGHRITPSKPYEEGEPLPGETMVSLLPVWHITERSFEMWMFSRACNVVYSSIRTFKKDLATHRPQWMVLVPRVLEKIALGVQDKFSSGSAAVKALSKFFTATSSARSKYQKIVTGLVPGDEKPGSLEKLGSKIALSALSPLNAVGDKLVWGKVQEGFGGRLKVIISGGSALAGSLESFYETAGIPICVGYGLTECSPLIAYRRSDANLITPGCVGQPTMDTELRVVDPDAKADVSERPALPIGEAGVVLARGPQVMQGYYKNPEATAKAIDKFGWFDTGDLGRMDPNTGNLILTGRAKDTIVLSNGENIEPQPLEDAILGESQLIEQVMLTGQDGRRLVAITVLTPNELVYAGFLSEKEGKELQDANEKVNDPKCNEEDCAWAVNELNTAAEKLRSNKELQKLLVSDVKRATTEGFRKWEQVSDVYLTLEPFAMANGQLTQSYKVKRAAVTERYADSLPE